MNSTGPFSNHALFSTGLCIAGASLNSFIFPSAVSRAVSLSSSLLLCFVSTVCNGEAQTVGASRASTGDRRKHVREPLGHMRSPPGFLSLFTRVPGSNSSNLILVLSVLASFTSCLTDVNLLPGNY
jgi:hypothetical protein